MEAQLLKKIELIKVNKFYFVRNTQFIYLFQVSPPNPELQNQQLDVVIGAEGKRVTLPGFRLNSIFMITFLKIAISRDWF